VNTSQPHLRRFTRVTALAVVVALPLLPTPANAQIPENWSNPPEVDNLHALLLLGGVPLALFVVITLLVMAPSLARGEHSVGEAGDGEWFGGPGKGTKELEEASADPSETGGASGRW
jgi:hypothetical protein